MATAQRQQLMTEAGEKAIEIASYHQLYFDPLTLSELEELLDKFRDCESSSLTPDTFLMAMIT